jgi:hypothetical protein
MSAYYVTINNDLVAAAYYVFDYSTLAGELAGS